MADTDIATIGIAVDTSQVVAADAVLDRFVAKGQVVEAMLTRLEKASAAAFKGVDPRMLSDGMAGVERQATAAEAAFERMRSTFAASRSAAATTSSRAAVAELAGRWGMSMADVG